MCVQNVYNVQEVADVTQAFSKIIIVTHHEQAQGLSGHIHAYTYAYVHFVTIHFLANAVSTSFGKGDLHFLLCDVIAIMIEHQS